MLVLATGYFYQDPEWNGNSRLDLTRAVVEQGTLRIDAYESAKNWATGDKAFYGGHFYSDKAIGSSALALPPYFILYHLAAALGVTLSSAFIKHVLTAVVVGGAFTIAGLAMYLVALRITRLPISALVTALAVSFGTMLWPYSAVFYGHVVAAGLLILAFSLLFAAHDEAVPFRTARYFWVGFLVGLALITEYTAALIVGGLVVYTVHTLRRRQMKILARAVIGATLGAAFPLAIMFAYNAAVYGSAFSTGYAFETESGFSAGMSRGLLGVGLPSPTNTFHITFDPQFGLFWLSPVLLLAAIGFYVALRTPKFRAEALLSLYSIGAMVAMNGGYYLWWGGSAFGPRLLIPALPFFIVPLAVLPPRLLWITAVLGGVSAAQMLIPLVGQIQTTTLSYRLHRSMFYVADKPFTGFSLLYDYSLPEIARRYASGAPSWTLGTALGLPYWSSVPALIAAEIGLIVLFQRHEKSHDLQDNGVPLRKQHRAS